jgi:hypothetical protein
MDALCALVRDSEGVARTVNSAVTPAAVVPTQLEVAFLLVCIRPRSVAAADAMFASLAQVRLQGPLWNGDQVRSRREQWLRGGITLSRYEFDALNAAGAALLVPQAQEPRLLNEGADPLKVF